MLYFKEKEKEKSTEKCGLSPELSGLCMHSVRGGIWQKWYRNVDGKDKWEFQVSRDKGLAQWRGTGEVKAQKWLRRASRGRGKTRTTRVQNLDENPVVPTPQSPALRGCFESKACFPLLSNH